MRSITMKIDYFIITVYTLIGLMIAAITAFMTFLIIGTPIGMKMLLQIISAIVLVLPIIVGFSYFFSKYLARKFGFIENRLEDIRNENFTQNDTKTVITEINQINQNMNYLSNRLDSLIKDLKQKNQNLSNLLISMAHDIKTPLTILKGHIEELEDGMIDKEDLPTVFQRLKLEIDFLNEITNDMVEYISSINGCKEKSDIKFREFIDIDILPLLPIPKEVRYINDIGEDLRVEFNRVDLKKICLNILNNSHKFTKKGYIKVYNLDNDIVAFENTGEQIPQRYSQQIFNPFFTVSQSKNRKKSGFGLGLSIVKNLAKNNGYDCYLSSSDKEKTIFHLQKSAGDE